MADLGTLFVNVGARIDGLEKGMAKATSTVQSAVGNMQSTIASGAGGITTVTSSVAKLETQTAKFSLTSQQSASVLKKLNSELVQTAAQSLGVSSGIGSILSMLGSFTIGGGPVAIALAGIAALALAWQKYKESQVEAVTATDKSIAALRKLRDASPEAQLGARQNQMVDALKEQKRLLDLVNIMEVKRLSIGSPVKSAEQLAAMNELKDITSLIAFGMRDIESADITKPFKEAKKEASELEKILQNLAEFSDAFAITEFKGRKPSLKDLAPNQPDFTELDRRFRGPSPIAPDFLDPSKEGAIVRGPSAVGAAATQQVGAAMGGITELVAAMSPLGIVATLLSGVFEGLAPVIEAVKEPIRLVGVIFGSALAPVLKALFPAFKIVAIAATYVGEILFKVAEGIAIAVGSVIKGLFTALSKIPLIGGAFKGLAKFGQSIIDLGHGFGESADELHKGRDELRNLDWEDVYEPAKEAAESFGQALNNVTSGFKIQLRTFQATTGRVVVNGDLHVHGVEDPKGMTDAVETESRRRTARGGGSITLKYA